MNLEERIISAQAHNELRDVVIQEYMTFILSCASKSLSRHINESDDAFSVAMIAFNEAITKYDSSKGSFLNFAALVIRNKMTDYLRKEYQHKNVIPFISLSSEDDNGEEVIYEIADKNSEISDTALEIQSVKQELERMGISFFDLPKSSPKSRKTKNACLSVIHYLCSEKKFIQFIQEKRALPSKLIMEQVKVNEKLLQRHRKYIIAGVIIVSGEYEIMSEYFCGGKRVK